MLAFIVISVLIYAGLRLVVIESPFWAVVCTLAIMILCVSIEENEIRFKTEAEIKISIDGAKDTAIVAAEKAGEASVGIKEAFNNGQEKAAK